MQIQGKITHIGEAHDVSDKLKLRDLVVTTNDEYPQDILIQFFQERCADLDSFLAGQEVMVDFRIKGKKWTNPDGVVKYFNSLNGWKVTRIGTTTAQPVSSPSEPEAVMPAAAASKKDEEDDLPF